jgi:tRNA A-37 threonylcarbamoyl transferase component Bud32
MGDERTKDAGQDGDDSWTDVEQAPPDLVEALPIRHGMVLGGRYAIERIIGRGGSGVVVRAHDRDLNQVVAIKIVRAELAGQRVWATRLAREVRLARQIHHPHVCRVFDFQQADGRVFLVMELAQGTLRDEIRSGAAKARPLAERIADARAMASALAAIHAAGIVHRDLSPQNMLRLEDGRLVLSDFGLATETSESTSVHGGTIAYMAPEVMRGDHSTPAADIWSLGALMYEIVFGDKPSWSEGASPEILTPALGRKLTEEERAVLDACRACTFKDPAKRIPSAAWAERLLAERRRWRLPRLAPARRPVIWASALTVIAAAAVGVGLSRQQRSNGANEGSTAASEPPLIVPTGEPADWSQTSTVLVETPERITCTRLLPDQRTIRIVWGTPPRAEDIDTVTRKRVASPLVPVAYAQGCPDLSPDGRRLVFQGHAKDGRAFAFLSENPDGKDAVPVVPTAEPTMASEPTWIGDGQTFSYDVDARHVGVFSTALRRVTIVPEVPSHAYVTLFRASTGDSVLVSGVFDTGHTEVTTVGLPWLKEQNRFRVSEFLMDLRSHDGLLYAVGRSTGKQLGMLELDPQRGRARRLGAIRDQTLRSPLVSREWLSFVSTRFDHRLTVRQRDGSFAELPGGDRIFHASRCGNNLIVDRGLESGGVNVEIIDRSGRLIRRVSNGPITGTSSCTPDGREWFFMEGIAPMVIKRCSEKECRVLAERIVYGLSASPDGTRLAFVTLASRGPLVGWMPADGGPAHDVTDSETGCQAGWASNNTLWVSRRRDGKILWTEVDADSGKETGKTVPGERDCSDGGNDPASPVDTDLRVVASRVSQLRLLPRAQLNRQ